MMNSHVEKNGRGPKSILLLQLQGGHPCRGHQLCHECWREAPRTLLTIESWVMGGVCYKATGNWIRKNEQQSFLKSEKHQWPTESFLLLLCLGDTFAETKKKCCQEENILFIYLAFFRGLSVVRCDKGRGRGRGGEGKQIVTQHKMGSAGRGNSREGRWRVAGTVVLEQVTSERMTLLSTESHIALTQGWFNRKYLCETQAFKRKSN